MEFGRVEGATDAVELGDRDGDEGKTVGSKLNKALGWNVGCIESAVDGTIVLSVLNEGCGENCNAFELGFCDGAPEGRFVGVLDGNDVGERLSESA